MVSVTLSNGAVVTCLGMAKQHRDALAAILDHAKTPLLSPLQDQGQSGAATSQGQARAEHPTATT